MDFKCLDCGYEWNHSDMVGARKCPKCIGVNIERNPNAEGVSANPLLGDVCELDELAINEIIEKESMMYFKRYMVSKDGKWWAESILPEWKKAYKQAFIAGFKAGLKRANIA